MIVEKAKVAGSVIIEKSGGDFGAIVEAAKETVAGMVTENMTAPAVPEVSTPVAPAIQEPAVPVVEEGKALQAGEGLKVPKY